MVYSDPDAKDAGYATVAAAMISLILSVVAAMLLQHAGVQLKAARLDQQREEIAQRLAAHQSAAEIDLMRSSQHRPLRWTITSAAGPADVYAEPEMLKPDGPTAIELGLPRRLEALSPDRVKAVLHGRSARPIALIDDAPAWRACAPGAVSWYGTDALSLPPPPVDRADGRAEWRAGQLWRIRVTSEGWTDDRLVRFTGDPHRPAAIVERSLYRAPKEGYACEALLNAQ